MSPWSNTAVCVGPWRTMDQAIQTTMIRKINPTKAEVTLIISSIRQPSFEASKGSPIPSGPAASRAQLHGCPPRGDLADAEDDRAGHQEGRPDQRRAGAPPPRERRRCAAQAGQASSSRWSALT